MPWIERRTVSFQIPLNSTLTWHLIADGLTSNTPKDGEINDDVSNQQDATNSVYWSFLKTSSTCFGRQTRPSSGALFDCIYSFWYNAPILLLSAGWTLNLLGTSVATSHGLVSTAVVARRVATVSNMPSAGRGYYSRIRKAYVADRL